MVLATSFQVASPGSVSVRQFGAAYEPERSRSNVGIPDKSMKPSTRIKNRWLLVVLVCAVQLAVALALVRWGMGVFQNIKVKSITKSTSGLPSGANKQASTGRQTRQRCFSGNQIRFFGGSLSYSPGRRCEFSPEYSADFTP